MEKENKPVVSVIIPSYNAAEFIIETIAGVLSQTIKDIEVIVIDDASIDNTISIVQMFCRSDDRIRYFIQEGRRGVSVARNRGIKEAKGSYIAFIDHDDLWLPQKLEKQLEVFKSDKDIGLVFSREAIISENGKIKGLFGGFSRPLRGYIFRELFVKHFIPLSAVVVRRKVFDSIDEWFPESMEMAEEVDLFLRIAHSWKIDYCDEVLAKWRDHPRSDSKLRLGLLIRDYNAILERLNKKIPRFQAEYEKEIRDKHEWIEKSEIRILISQGNRKEALDKAGSFFRKFGFKPVYIFELLIILTIGFPAFDKVRATCTNFYHKLCNKT